MDKHPFIVREEFSLPEGPVVLVFPNRLDIESVLEIEDWLGLVVRKLKRWSNTEVIGTDSAEATPKG